VGQAGWPWAVREAVIVGDFSVTVGMRLTVTLNYQSGTELWLM
jgi:hypothetical protein